MPHVLRRSPLFQGRIMLYRGAHGLRFPFAGALLVCVVLFLLSGLEPASLLSCCGESMGFPFLCLGIVCSLFSLLALLVSSRRRPHDVPRLPTASGRLLRHCADLLFSEHLHGEFFVALLLSTALLLSGAGLLFSLSLSFTWPALALGCLSLLSGLAVLFPRRQHPSL